MTHGDKFDSHSHWVESTYEAVFTFTFGSG